MPTSNLYQRPGFLLRRAHQISGAVFENACAALGLTQAQFGVLTIVASEPGIDQTRLARALAFDKVTVMRVLKGLQQRGLLERATSPTNRRPMAVHLTREGKALLAQAQAPAEQACQQLLAPLSTEQRRQLIDLLDTLTAGLAEHARAPFVPLD
jgi:DNA-binding MarR family transcriptional regulator